MRAGRLLSGAIAGLAAVAVMLAGALGAPAQAQECHPEIDDTCESELDRFTQIFLDLQVNVTEPDQRTREAVAEFVTAVRNALSSREQAIIAELNGLRVAQATAALRTVIGGRNSLRDPDMSIRRDYVGEAAEAAYLTESLLVVSGGDPETADQLGRVGMAAYAVFVTATIAADENRPQPEADEELILVLGEFIRFLELLLDILSGEGGTADDASEAKDALEDAVEEVRNRDPGEGGGGPSTIEYVALGDSYSSGAGAGVYTVPGPADCRRSRLAFAGLLNGALTADGRRLQTVNVACYGATFVDYAFPQMGVRGIEGPQRSRLSRETTGLVTVTMGGNDLSFPLLVRGCLMSFAGFCGVGAGNPLAPPERLDQVRENLTLMYISILSQIRPEGRLAVLTYANPTPPSFPNDTPCWVTNRLISEAELAQIADFATDVRLMIETAVAAVGSPRVQVVDMTDAYQGHWLCERDAWVHSLTSPLADSFHPKAAGYREAARRIAQALNLIPLVPL